MKVSRQIALAITLSLLASMSAFAAVDTADSASTSSPVYISQSLPPVQGNGYTSPGFNTYGNQQYGQQPYNQYNQQPYSQSPLQGYVVTAPAGTVVSANISTPISSEYARVGDRFMASLGSPIASGSSVILPAGSQMEGQVVMVKSAGRTGRNGELEVRFTSATLPNGQRVPLSARLQTEDGTGILKGGATAGRVGRAAVNTGVGAGLGAALGTAMGPLSGGGVGRGAIYGTILGAGMGALGSAWQKGKPAVLDSSQPVNVVLDQPLTTSPATDNGSYQQQAPNYYQQNPQPSNFYGGQ